jgi:membrane protease YdiL (CAAX protease family)
MQELQVDKFSRIFVFTTPILIPTFVTIFTYLFYPICPSQFIWLPLLLIYWGIIWFFTLYYHAKKGNVFNKERFKITLQLQGDHLKLQYLLIYGPLVYAIPLFIINYSRELSPLMYLALVIASIINGPSEEVFWRACMDEAGKNAGLSEKQRLIYTPIVFALWHTAFVIHLAPWIPNVTSSVFIFWCMIIAMTWSSGLIWHWVMHKSRRLVPQCIYHACGNFLNIFPMILITVIQLYF